jgi:hypothetical protein
MGGGKNQTSAQQVTIPPDVLARYNSVNAQAQQAASQPFQQYSSDPNAFVAPLTPTQQAGISNTNMAAGQAQPYFNAATQQLTGAQQAATPFVYGAAQGTQEALQQGTAANQQAAGLYGTGLAAGAPLIAASGAAANAAPITGQTIGQYMDPYLQSVVGQTAALQNQQNQQAMAGQTGNAIQQGAFGGDRAGIAAANLQGQQNLATGNLLSGLLSQGYGQALSTAQQQQGVNLGAQQANLARLGQAGQGLAGLYGSTAAGLGGLGQQQYAQGAGAAQQQAALGQQLYGMGAGTSQALAGLGAGAQGAALQGAQAQLAAGQAAQQTQQAGQTALYNQFLQQQSYPFQVSQFLANIAEGTGALSGSTTTTSQPGGFFSDERLKENIEPIGETFDGQKVYSYNYKGEKHKQIGLIAQDVEKKHPHAVGSHSGYKTVDYGKATEAAADRGHFYRGGLVPSSEGGAVTPAHLGEGFAGGGSPALPNATDMAALLAAQAQMFGPFSQGGLYGGESMGVPGGGSGRVPAANLPVSHLAVAGGLPKQGPSALEQASQIADVATKSKDAWDKIKAKDPAPAPAPATAPETNPNDIISLSTSGVAGDNNHYAEGGMPYSQQTGPGLNIPDDQKEAPKLMTASGGLGKPQSGLSEVAGVAGDIGKIASLATMFSDKRLKENIKKIGKTYDGQNIYSYNYKGDHSQQIGLLAQDVEKRHPHAVGLANGYKTVDYDKATAHAADRGHFYSGGVAGGRHGYAVDGTVDDTFPAADFGGPDDQESTANILMRRHATTTAPPMPDIAPPSSPQAQLPNYDVQDYVDRGLLARSQNAPLERPPEPTGVKPPEMPRVQGQYTMPSEREAHGVLNNLSDAYLRMGDAAMQHAQDPHASRIMKYAVDPLTFGLTRGLSTFPASLNALFSESGTPFYPQSASDAGKTHSFDTENSKRYVMGSDPTAEARLVGRKPGVASAAPSQVAPTSGGLVPPSKNMGPPLPTAGANQPTQEDITGYAEHGAPYINYGHGPVQTGVLPAVSPTSAGVGAEQPGFFDRLGNAITPEKGGFLDRMTETRNLIPLLSGVAAMGTAPTRNWGVALASGLGAGAKSYMGTQEKLADIGQTKAQTRGEQISATTADVALAQKLITLEAMGLIKRDPRGPISDAFDNHYSRVNASPSAPSYTGGNYKYITPPIASALDVGKRNYIINSGAGGSFNQDAIRQSNALADQIDRNASESADNVINSRTQASALFSPERKGPLQQGALAPIFSRPIALWNASVGAANKDLVISGLGDTQIADKIAMGRALAMASASGERALGALEGIRSTVPNSGMDPDAAATLVASSMATDAKAMDEGNIINEARRQSPGGNFMMQPVHSAFRNDENYSPQKYNQMKGAIKSVLLNPNFHTLSMKLDDPQTHNGAVNTINAIGEAHGVKNLSRAFTGRVE